MGEAGDAWETGDAGEAGNARLQLSLARFLFYVNLERKLEFARNK